MLTDAAAGEPLDRGAARVDHCLAFAREKLGARIEPGAKILDFGCGAGFHVRALLERGFDAWGVDVYDAWNREALASAHPSSVVARLRLIEAIHPKLPFPDHTFDFCFSDQVMEHVFDDEGVFAELIRVLKPDALSLHWFPGDNYPFEGHVHLPFPWLCRYRGYLALCAMLGLRGPGQRGMTWREVYARNVVIMRGNNYRPKKALRAAARRVGGKIEFVEREELAFRGGGRLGKVYGLAARLGVGGLLLFFVGFAAQRCMVLRAT